MNTTPYSQYDEVDAIDLGWSPGSIINKLKDKASDVMPDMPNIPGMPDMPDLPGMPDLPDVGSVKDLISQGVSIAKKALSKVNAMRKEAASIARNAAGKARNFAEEGLEDAYDRAMKVKKMAENRFDSLTDKLRNGLNNVKGFAKRHAEKAYRMAKEKARFAYDKAIEARDEMKEYADDALDTAMAPVKGAIREYKIFRNIAIGGIVGVGALSLIAILI